MEELSSFIGAVYRAPYSRLHNNCIHKSLRIRKKALKLGKKVDLIFCLSIVPIKKWHLPTVSPHFYIEIEGRKVDVSLDPEHERRYCLNGEKKLILPVNISRIGRRLLEVKEFLRGRLRAFHAY